MILLDTPELNAETPAHLLDDDITPIARLFARNTGAMPVLGAGRDRGLDARASTAWCGRRARWTHRRAEARVRDRHRDRRDRMRRQRPRLLPAAGRHGAVAPRRGRLRALDRRAARRPAATLRAAAARRSTPATTAPTSISTARDRRSRAACRSTRRWRRETLVAFALNGEPLPALHGGPLRLVVPGYPGASFQKWLTRIELRDREHDGERMTDGHYRMPRAPLRYGEPFDEAQFEIITDMPVKSLITSPRDGFAAPAGAPLRIRGHAWSGHAPVDTVDAVVRRRRSWRAARLGPAARPLRLAAVRVHARRRAARARSRSSRAPPTRTAALSRWTACRGTRAATATTCATGCGVASTRLFQIELQDKVRLLRLH